MGTSSIQKKNKNTREHSGKASAKATSKKAAADQGKQKPPKKTELQKTYSTKKANRYFVLFFFVASLALYGNTLMNKWAVDDNFVTGPQNEQVKKGFAAIPEIFRTFYVDTKGNVGSQQTDYRPIVKMTFAIEYGILGKDRPAVSHFINILLYFWISTLLFFVLRRLLKDYNILFPFLITLLFMVHPVHTEVVASLKNRDELLAFLCGIGSLHFFLKHYETKNGANVFWGVLLILVGFLCKTSIAPFIALIPLVLYFFTQIKPKNFIWIALLILFAIGLGYFIPRMFLLPHSVRVNSFVENPLFFDHSLWMRTGTGMMTLLFYLKMMVFPYPLLYYYGYNMVPVTGWMNILVIVSFLVHAGLFVYAVRKMREKTILSFSILYYLVAIAMYTNMVKPAVGIVAERFTFNASLGFVIALVYLIFRLFRTDPKSLTIDFSERAKIFVVIFLIMIPATAMTIRRNREWRNTRDLYKADIKYLGNSFKANVDYAKYLTDILYRDPNFLREGLVNEQLQSLITAYYCRALRIYPNDYTTVNDLAAAYINFTPKIDSGQVYLRKAITLNPELQPAWVNMAMVYRKRNKIDSAIYCYEKVLRINPQEITAVFKIADLYFEKGNVAKAMKMNENVMKAYPNLDIPYFNIGYYHFMQGDTASAVQYWEQAANRNPTYEVCTNLAMMYKIRGDMQKAQYYSGLAKEAQQRRRQTYNP